MPKPEQHLSNAERHSRARVSLARSIGSLDSAIRAEKDLEWEGRLKDARDLLQDILDRMAPYATKGA